MGHLGLLVVIVICFVAVISADLTTTTVSSGDCVCATSSVNARNAAGLSSSVILTIRTGQCVTISGTSTAADGYTWYQVTYNGQTLWVAGLYFSKSSSSSCVSVRSTGSCSSVQRQLACELLNNYGSKLILATAHQSTRSDNAYARNNLRDMCDGRQAARSSYSCSECRTSPAPGGSVCISESVLRYLKTLVSNGSVKVNELAGACHSCTSKHYQGLAIDLGYGSRNREYINTCNNLGGIGIDERNHIHCQFNR